MTTSSLQTERVTLRRWVDADRQPFAAMNADPEVMEFFPAPLTRTQSDALIDRIEQNFDDRGFGLWALEVRHQMPAPRFAGFVGLFPATFDAPFTPAIEVGWRLDRWAWGHGYATEAAHAVLADGFERLKLPEIVSFTAAINTRSRRVMERLGMQTDASEDFRHPSVPLDDPLAHHVLYRRSGIRQVPPTSPSTIPS